MEPCTEMHTRTHTHARFQSLVNESVSPMIRLLMMSEGGDLACR